MRRLLFLSVAEDRGVLLYDASAETADRYARYFSVGRLRRLSRVRASGPHGDLWQGLTVVLRALGGDGLPALGLPALAGLFDPDDQPLDEPGGAKVDHLLACSLANNALLPAMRHLGWIYGKADRVQPVDYRNLGAEELGSVYESLLELVPRLDLSERTFALEHVAGNERKTTGSYYTPSSLVSALLDSALDPLLDRRTEERGRQRRRGAAPAGPNCTPSSTFPTADGSMTRNCICGPSTIKAVFARSGHYCGTAKHIAAVSGVDTNPTSR